MSAPSGKRSSLSMGVVKSSRPSKRARVILPMVRVQSVPRPLIGFPRDRIVEMRYCSFKTLTCTTGVMAEQVVRANSIFDPDATGVGHQALGHDQWASFYKSYIVLGAKIACTVSSSSGQTVPQVTGVYHTSDSGITATGYDTVIEQGKSHYCVTNPSTAIDTKVIHNSFDAKNFYNLKDVKDNKYRIGADFGANPNEMNYFIIWHQSQDQSTTSEVKVIYAITYRVLLTDSQELAQS